MTGFRNFDSELAGLETLLSEAMSALRRICALPFVSPDAVDREQAEAEVAAGAAFVRHLVGRFARLALQLDRATDGADSDIRALTESRAAGRSSRRRVRKGRATLEESESRSGLAHLLAISDSLMDLHGSATELLDDCHRASERQAEQATRRAVALSEAVVDTERQAAALEAAIAETERRFTPETVSEAAVDLARDHAGLLASRSALSAKKAELHEEQSILAGSVTPLREFLVTLGEGRKSLRALGDKLLSDTERRVILHDAVEELLGGHAEAPRPHEDQEPPTMTERLLDLRRKGALAMPVIMQRKSEADAVFDRLFADTVRECRQGEAQKAGGARSD